MKIDTQKSISSELRRRKKALGKKRRSLINGNRNRRERYARRQIASIKLANSSSRRRLGDQSEKHTSSVYLKSPSRSRIFRLNIRPAPRVFSSLFFSLTGASGVKRVVGSEVIRWLCLPIHCWWACASESFAALQRSCVSLTARRHRTHRSIMTFSLTSNSFLRSSLLRNVLLTLTHFSLRISFTWMGRVSASVGWFTLFVV